MAASASSNTSSASSVSAFPRPEPSDPEDVSLALETAEALYCRGDFADALRWLRRAADAAEQSGNDMRAVALARSAADLRNEMAQLGEPMRGSGDAGPATTSGFAPAGSSSRGPVEPRETAPPPLSAPAGSAMGIPSAAMTTQSSSTLPGRGAGAPGSSTLTSGAGRPASTGAPSPRGRAPLSPLPSASSQAPGGTPARPASAVSRPPAGGSSGRTTPVTPTPAVGSLPSQASGGAAASSSLPKAGARSYQPISALPDPFANRAAAGKASTARSGASTPSSLPGLRAPALPALAPTGGTPAGSPLRGSAAPPKASPLPRVGGVTMPLGGGLRAGTLTSSPEILREEESIDEISSFDEPVPPVDAPAEAAAPVIVPEPDTKKSPAKEPAPKASPSVDRAKPSTPPPATVKAARGPTPPAVAAALDFLASEDEGLPDDMDLLQNSGGGSGDLAQLLSVFSEHPAVRVSVKRSVRDKDLYIVRRLNTGNTPPAGTSEAVLVLVGGDASLLEADPSPGSTPKG